jgi:flagellar motility protein MotE (MotC chaperone)
VSIGGVLAMKALTGAQALPDLLAGASAHAEAAKPVPAKAGAPAAKTPMPAQVAAAPKPTPACATSPAELAREAGLSPGELQTLQNLQTRRGQLDDREQKLDTQIQLLAAAEAKVDAKIKAMNLVKGQIQGLLGQADQQQQADVDRLTSVYQKMKPADAAAVMATLDEKVRIAVVAKMKDAALAAILGKMPTEEAKKLTESLAQRATAAKASLQAAEHASAQPAPAATATAAASPDPTEPPPAAKPKAKPRREASARRKTPHEAVAAVTKQVPVIVAPLVKNAAAAPAPAPKAASPAVTSTPVPGAAPVTPAAKKAG